MLFDNVLLFGHTTLPQPLPEREGGKKWQRELSTDYADWSRLFKRIFKRKKKGGEWFVDIILRIFYC